MKSNNLLLMCDVLFRFLPFFQDTGIQIWNAVEIDRLATSCEDGIQGEGQLKNKTLSMRNSWACDIHFLTSGCFVYQPSICCSSPPPSNTTDQFLQEDSPPPSNTTDRFLQEDSPPLSNTTDQFLQEDSPPASNATDQFLQENSTLPSNTSQFEFEDSSTSPPNRTRRKRDINDNIYEQEFGFSIKISTEGLVSLIFVQLPGIGLGLLGILKAFMNHGLSKDAVVDSLR